jgi:hypothetical protein
VVVLLLLFTEGADEREVPVLLLRETPALLLREEEVRAVLLLPLLTVPELREADELRPFTLDERDDERPEVPLFTLEDDERDVVPEFFREELLPELRYPAFSRVVAREEEALRVEEELRPDADERIPALLRPEV